MMVKRFKREKLGYGGMEWCGLKSVRVERESECANPVMNQEKKQYKTVNW